MRYKVYRISVILLLGVNDTLLLNMLIILRLLPVHTVLYAVLSKNQKVEEFVLGTRITTLRWISFVQSIHYDSLPTTTWSIDRELLLVSTA